METGAWQQLEEASGCCRDSDVRRRCHGLITSRSECRLLVVHRCDFVGRRRHSFNHSIGTHLLLSSHRSGPFRTQDRCVSSVKHTHSRQSFSFFFQIRCTESVHHGERTVDSTITLSSALTVSHTHTTEHWAVYTITFVTLNEVCENVPNNDSYRNTHTLHKQHKQSQKYTPTQTNTEIYSAYLHVHKHKHTHTWLLDVIRHYKADTTGCTRLHDM